MRASSAELPPVPVACASGALAVLLDADPAFEEASSLRDYRSAASDVLMELAELVDGFTSGVGWPGSSKRGASLLFSAKSAFDPRRETINQFREDH
jgi:hypothetical protein